MSSDTLPRQAERTEQDQDSHALELSSRIEALLFVADEPAQLRQLAQALEVTEHDVEAALEQLAERCRERGLRLQRSDRQVQFVTAPQAAPDVQRFLGLDNTSTLSTAALETLALVAYRQPLTRPEIEAIRGVNCDSVLRTLLSRGLVTAQGRLDQAGRPIIYGTTFEFLQYFGLSDLSDLPDWADLTSSPGGGLNASRRQANETDANEEV